MMKSASSVLAEMVNPFDRSIPFLSREDRHVKQIPSALFFFGSRVQKGSRDTQEDGSVPAIVSAVCVSG